MPGNAKHAGTEPTTPPVLRVRITPSAVAQNVRVPLTEGATGRAAAT